MTKIKYFVLLVVVFGALGLVIAGYMIDWKAGLCFAGSYGLQRLARHLMKSLHVSEDQNDA